MLNVLNTIIKKDERERLQNKIYKKLANNILANFLAL